MMALLPQRVLALAPSLRGIGVNTYLGNRAFGTMLAAAFAVHVLVFVIAALWPAEEVKQIPVQALSFKLSDGIVEAAPSAAPRMVASAPEPEPVIEQVLEAETDRVAPELPKPTPKEKPKAKKLEKREAPKAEPAIAPTPQQYVREVGAAPAQPQPQLGSGTGNDAAMQAIRARYEQQISAWVQQHKLYPMDANGREGRAIVRVRIDRAGTVRYYAIEQSAGMQALDAAALDMIRRANPMPAVPADYPEGNLVEFLIPISFKAPND